MSFPRYESYKDSGVEWLGEVLAHWQTGQFKCRLDPGNPRHGYAPKRSLKLTGYLY